MRKVTDKFQLITPEGVIKYAVGDVVAPEHESHWYAEIHSVAIESEAPESEENGESPEGEAPKKRGRPKKAD